jgi:hypothetical protein
MDLRKEIKNLIINKEGVGRWVMVRHYSAEHSEYWNEATKEAVGGPAYKYTDTLVESYSAPVSSMNMRFTGMKQDNFGIVDEDLQKFYFTHDVVIDENDEIFDLEYYAASRPTVVFNQAEVNEAKGKVAPVTRYKVKTLHKYRGDQGRVEYKAAVCYKSVTR